MRKWMLTSLFFLWLVGFVSPLWAQSTVQYVYDALGRLTQVIDPTGTTATYNYDAVGNLLSITRSTTSPSSLAIFSFSPAQGSVGQTVTIQGQNFSTTPSSNTVKFNGTVSTVTAATANSLTTTAPSGATTGPISVTVGSSTANSPTNFTVLAVPVITSVSPSTPQVNMGSINPFTVNGSNLTGSTFSFLPAFTPALITISNVNINGNGTSATMTLTLASNAVGSFTVVATNGTGSSSTISTASNTLTVLSSDPFADFDGDGLTNIYEAAIGTNFTVASTTGDGLPDGWALFYTGTAPLNPGLGNQTAPNGKTYLASFQQGLNPLLGTVAPQVSTIYPANTATNYPTNGVIVVRFTEALQVPVSLQAAQSAITAAAPTFPSTNAAAAAQVLQAYLLRTCCGGAATPAAIQVSQSGRLVAGSVFLSSDQMFLTFAPSKPFSASTVFNVTVQGVRDAGGNLMAQPYPSTFTTGLAAAENTPSVLTTNPPNGATGVEINTPFKIEFSTPVNPSTLTFQNPQNISVTDTVSGQAIPGIIQVDPFLLTASFVPAQPYGVGRTINVTFTPNVKDVHGNSYFTSNKTYTFTTGFVGDLQGPSLLSTSPADTAAGVPLNALVVLEFNDPMDAISALTGLQVQLAGVNVPGAIALSDGNKRITFTPTSALTASSTYTVITTPQLLDFAGNPLSNPNVSTFTTGTTTDTTSPSVSSVNPPNNATNVPTNAVIQAVFSKPIDPLTVTVATFGLSSPDVVTNTPNEQVPGTVTVSTDGKTATFNPTVPLLPGTDYSIGLSNAIMDMEGNALSFPGSSFTTGLNSVTTGPTVVVSPPNNATGVMVNAQIDVVSSAPISKTSAWSTAIALKANGVNVPLKPANLSTDQTTISVMPTSNLAVSTAYTVTVSGFTDEAGNPVQTSTTTFTTGTSGSADTSAPSVVTSLSNPLNNATGVSVTSTISLTFNKNIDPNSVNTNSLPVFIGNSLKTLAGTYNVSGATITFTPLTPLPGGAQIQVFVDNGTSFLYDFAGNLATSYAESFTTASVTDTTPPQVVSVTPVNGATGIGLNAVFVLTFSKSLSATTINKSNFALFANGTRILSGNIALSYSADGRVVTVGLGGGGLLQPLSTVTLVATPGVQDLSGNPLANFETQFTTAAAFDTVHPTVIGQRPGNNATGVPLNATVVLYVSEPMNAATVSGALHVSQNGVIVAGTTQVTDNGQTIVFTPSSSFQNGATIQVFLDSTASDVDGNSLSAYQGSFTTLPNTSTVAPAAVSTIPTNSTSGVPTNQTVAIEILFNEPLNPSTVNTSTVSIFDNTPPGTGVPITVNLIGGGTIIQAVPNAALQANASFNVNLKTTNGIQGTNGLSLLSAPPFGFFTGAGPDNVAPTVVLSSPQDGLTNVGNNAQVRVVFSKPVNPLSVTSSTIQLSVGGITEVPDSISFFVPGGSNNNTEVLLVPHAPLPDATQMTLTISGVTDLAGNPVTPLTTHFKTGTGPDVITPVATAQNPYNGETNVPLNTTIQLRINDLVDLGSVNKNTFPVTDQNTNQVLAGTYSLSPDGQTIIFLPSPVFAASHSIHVGAGGNAISNLIGNTVGSAPPDLADFTFTTGTAANTTAPLVMGISPPSGLTGVPINAQVVIQFNEPIDSLTLNQVTIMGGGGSVNFIPALTNGSQTLVLSPVVPFSPNTTYTVTVIGIQDISGNAMTSQVQQSFTTGLGADLSPAPTATPNPANNATGVLRSSVIQLQFSKRINIVTVTNSTFTVNLSGTPIAGSIAVSADGLTATFTPTSTLAASTTYQISASGGITDLVGQPLSFASTSFTTGTQ